VEALIEDPERTLLLPVALAEELPARETAELVARARSDLGIALDRVVVNAVMPPPFPATVPDLDARLAALPADAPLRGLPAPEVLADCGRHLRERHELNAHYVEAIGAETGLPVVELPYAFDGLDGPDALLRLSGPLLAGTGAPP